MACNVIGAADAGFPLSYESADFAHPVGRDGNDLELSKQFARRGQVVSSRACAIPTARNSREGAVTGGIGK